MNFNKPRENWRVLQHIDIIVWTFHAEERMTYPKILWCHYFKNKCATINIPLISPSKKTDSSFISVHAICFEASQESSLNFQYPWAKLCP
jgi:hypothetical protein